MKINSEIIEKKFEDNIDHVASIVHEVWAHWQAYLHSRCEELPDGSLKIPKELVDQWSHQISLTYDKLNQDEKKSDIEQAQKYKKTFLKIVDEIIKS